MSDVNAAFLRLVETMHRLRAPGGCPWDAEQTHDSLRPYLIEEAYEAMEALEDGDDRQFCEELGDVLLQVVFHAELARERGAFDIEDVVEQISDKLVRRHPHVFGDTSADTAHEVERSWSRLKAQEKRARAADHESPSVLAGLPRSLPTLLLAHRLGEKAAGVGFDWTTPAAARAKLDEELGEVDSALKAGDREALADELGDFLFAACSVIRLSGLNADNVLSRSLLRFRRRFTAMEQRVHESGRDIHDLAPAELDRLWTEVKVQD
ncbi:MAG: nucleoside triphosphate pyrophosphohydrolase [Candidatus Binatia bacterium]